MTTRTYTTTSDAVLKACNASLNGKRPIWHKFEAPGGDERIYGTVTSIARDPRRGDGSIIEIEVDTRYGSAGASGAAPQPGRVTVVEVDTDAGMLIRAAPAIPTHPGWWWARSRETGDVQVLKVTQRGSSLIVWFVDQFSGWTGVDDGSLEWLGEAIPPVTSANVAEGERVRGVGT